MKPIILDVLAVTRQCGWRLNHDSLVALTSLAEEAELDGLPRERAICRAINESSNPELRQRRLGFQADAKRGHR